MAGLLLKVRGTDILTYIAISSFIVHIVCAQKAYQHPTRPFWCFTCPQGFRVDSHCSESLTNSTCLPCEYGTYADAPNSGSNCQSCSTQSCPKNGVLVQNCTSTTNRECQCKKGYHKFPVDAVDPYFDCIPHRKCTSQQGEVNPGNATHDTECRLCIHMLEFVDQTDSEHPKCKQCNECPQETLHTAPCNLCFNTTNGTVLESVNQSSLVTNTTESSATESLSAPSQLSAGGIVGISLGLIGFAALAVLVVCLFRRYQNQGINRPRIGSTHLKEVHIISNGNTTHQESSSENNNLPQVPTSGSHEGDRLLGWSREFIMREVFVKLSQGLSNWTQFIMSLPGWSRPNRASVVVSHAQEDHKNHTETQILACLQKWAQECPGFVSKENILATLEKLNLNDLKEQLGDLRENS